MDHPRVGWLAGPAAALVALALAPARADVALDGSPISSGRDLGPGPDFAIRADDGTQVGGNLFHSFARFSPAAGERALFTPQGALGPIENVLARVTGGSPSEIDGTIATSQIPGASFFLLNPAGVLFGPGARLDVDGSFFAGSAGSLESADGRLRFLADPAAPSLLAAAPPEAFGFLSSAPVEVAGATLSVPPGRGLGLFGGGDVSLDGATLSTAPPGEGGSGPVVLSAGGRLTLSNSAVDTSSVSGDAGDVALAGDGVVLDGASVRALSGFGIAGSVRVTARTYEQSNQSGIQTGSVLGAGGDVSIDAEEGAIFRGSFVSTSGAAFDGIVPSAPSGSIRVTAGSVRMEDGTLFGAGTLGSGTAGDITLEATGEGSVEMRGASGLLAVTESSGNAGAIRIRAGGTVAISEASGAFGSTSSSGQGGAIEIEGGEIRVTTGSQLGSAAFRGSTGDAGSLTLRAERSIHVSGANTVTGTLGAGDGGDVRIEAPHVEIENASVAPFTVGPGRSGDLLVVGERIELRGSLLSTEVATAPDFDVPGEGTGDGGTTLLEASEAIHIVDTGVSTSTAGSGDAGVLLVRAPLLVAEGADSLLSSISDGSGRGGLVDVEVGRLVLRDGASIATSAAGSGRGGDVRVTALDSVRIEGAEAAGASAILSATIGSGESGDVMIEAPLVSIDRGLVTAQTKDGGGAAGAVEITAVDVLLAQGARITSESTGAGNAGDIRIAVSGRLELVGGSQISSSAETAFAGSILVNGEAIASGPDGGLVAVKDGAPFGDLVHLVDSRITTSVAQGVGGGGDILIDPRFVILEDSEIRADAGGEGRGGRVLIVADAILANAPLEEIVTARSERGVQGTVALAAPDVDVAGSLAALPEAFLDASQLLRERCAARRRGETTGSFVARSRDGRPPSPEGPLPAPLALGSHAGTDEGPAEPTAAPIAGGPEPTTRGAHGGSEPAAAAAGWLVLARCGAGGETL